MSSSFKDTVGILSLFGVLVILCVSALVIGKTICPFFYNIGLYLIPWVVLNLFLFIIPWFWNGYHLEK